jgi:hypothetical protein
LVVAKQGKNTVHWAMTQKYLDLYHNDPEIKCVELTISVVCWWNEPRKERLQLNGQLELADRSFEFWLPPNSPKN